MADIGKGLPLRAAWVAAACCFAAEWAFCVLFNCDDQMENSMNDESGARPPQARQTVRDAEQVDMRLRRLGQLGHSDMARRGRINLMFDVLDGIASGLAENPARVAAAFVARINRDELLGARSHAPQLVENVNSAASLIRVAEKAAHRAAVPEVVLSYLYKKSRWAPLSKRDWAEAVRTAFSIDAVINALLGLPSPESKTVKKLLNRSQLETFVAPEAVALSIDQLKSATNPFKGTLMLTFHGAYPLLARELFVKSYKEGLIFGRNGTIRGNVRITTGFRDGLFVSLRTLQNGGAILMAPDGPDGRRSVRCSVLDTVFMAGEGAAFLAHASNCNTAWYTVVRDGNRFVPVIEPGPTRNDGEPLNQFSERLYGFYFQKIEEILTGDPHNIIFRPNWSKHFASVSIRK